jgi:hypothetical protein
MHFVILSLYSPNGKKVTFLAIFAGQFNQNWGYFGPRIGEKYFELFLHK